MQPAGCVKPGQQAGGTESAFFWKAGCFFAATGSCAFASFSLYVVLLALKCVQKIVSKSIKILIAALRCVCRFAFFLLLRDSFATLRFGCDSVAALRFGCCFAIRLLFCDSFAALRFANCQHLSSLEAARRSLDNQGPAKEQPGTSKYVSKYRRSISGEPRGSPAVLRRNLHVVLRVFQPSKGPDLQ